MLDELKKILLPGAWVAVRLTNRHSGMRFLSRFSSRVPYDLLGDAVVSYSPKAARRLFERAGFEKISIERDSGRGKRLSAKKTALYAVTGVISVALPESAMLTPGFFLFAQFPPSV